MRSNFSAVTGPAIRSLLLVGAVSTLPSALAQDSDVPPAVRDLLPASLEVKNQGWSVMKEEFGTILSGQMQAFFPDSVTCSYTIGPELNLELQGDSAWEGSPEQLEMFAQMTAPDLQAQGEGMASSTRNMLQGLGDELSVGEPQQEQLPNGQVTFVEFNWKCPENPEGRNVKLEGYGRKGATILEFSFWANGGKEEALELARGILAKFEELDIDALRQ